MNPLPVRNLSHRVRYRAVQFKPAAPILPEVWHRRDTCAASRATHSDSGILGGESGGVKKKGRAGMNLRGLSFN
jgi:hypothetical protein